MNYTKHVGTKQTPQHRPIPGSTQVKNSAGGYSFAVSDSDRLTRFLILGSQGGTYYSTEQELTVENADAIIRLIKADGENVVKTVVEISDSGRAPKNDPAIFVLALAATFGDSETKTATYAAIPKVCRIGTHIYQFCQAVQDLRGWSRGLRRGVASYYTSKSDAKLALDLVKYRQRDGWTHRDVLRLAHPTPATAGQQELFKYAVGKGEGATPDNDLIRAFEEVQTLKATDKKTIRKAVVLIEEYELPREALPTELLSSKEVWEAMLPHMPMTALIRNLGKMTSVGLFNSNLSSSVKLAVEKLTDETAIRKSRIHPLNVLQARATYGSGGGFKGKLTWEPVSKIMDALDQAFYTAFGNVESTGQNYLLAVDCSGSMGSPVANSSLTCRTAAAAMALVTASVENSVEIVGFSNGRAPSRWSGTHSMNSGIAPINVTAKSRLGDVESAMDKFPWGGTDCALPMLYAIEKKLHVDTFIVYTDSETWAGNIHPTQALAKYRKEFNPNAKLIVVGMNSNGFTIADPNDRGMLDVVGFDTATPNIIASFSEGRI